MSPKAAPARPFWETWRILVPALALCALSALLLVLRAPRFFHQDGVHYLSLAEHLATGRGYRSALHLFPDLMQPPLYPLLVAGLLRLLGSTFAAGVAMLILCGGLGVVAVYLLHGAVFGASGRAYSVLCAAVYPNLAIGTGMTLEPLFVALLGLAVYLAVTAATRQQLWRAGCCGLVLGLALLTRPEVVLTGAGIGGFCIFWPARLRACAAAVVLIGVGFLVVALPYGLWMKGQLGHFEILPKVRYNVPVSDITENMNWSAHELRTTARDQRTGYSLMPDHRTFILHHAFTHPEFDPRPLYPRRRHDHEPSLWSHLRRDAQLLRHAPGVVADGARLMGVFQPVAAVCMTLVLLALWRRRPLPGAALTDRGYPTVVLLYFALIALHLLPAIISGEDFESRYLAPSLFFSLPLVGAGAAYLSDSLGQHVRQRLVGAAVALLLMLSYGVLTLRTSRAITGGPRAEHRTRAIGEACQRHLPAGARILSEHNRCGFLVGGSSFQLPYVRDQQELLDYIAAHDIHYAVFDGRTLRKNPSLADSTLADPRGWPAGWVPILGLFEDDDPVWLVKLR